MMVTLEDLAEGIILGQVISRIEEKEKSENIGYASVLTLKAINGGVIDSKETSEIYLSKEVDKRKKLRKMTLL